MFRRCVRESSSSLHLTRFTSGLREICETRCFFHCHLKENSFLVDNLVGLDVHQRLTARTRMYNGTISSCVVVLAKRTRWSRAVAHLVVLWELAVDDNSSGKWGTEERKWAICWLLPLCWTSETILRHRRRISIDASTQASSRLNEGLSSLSVGGLKNESHRNGLERYGKNAFVLWNQNAFVLRNQNLSFVTYALRKVAGSVANSRSWSFCRNCLSSFCLLSSTHRSKRASSLVSYGSKRRLLPCPPPLVAIPCLSLSSCKLLSLTDWFFFSQSLLSHPPVIYLTEALGEFRQSSIINNSRKRSNLFWRFYFLWI